MKKYLIGLLALLLLVSCVVPNETASSANCANIDPEHTPENSLDWFATYTGLLPCASCDGIKTELILNENETYQITEEYLATEPMKTVVKGNFTWTDQGSVIRLDDKMNNRSYRVTEAYVFHLDEDGKVIKGHLAENYKLIKIEEVESY